MKKYLLAASAALLIALPLSASTRPEPGKFGLKGEWIYFYPSIDDSYFALQGTPSPSLGVTLPIGQKFNNNFNFTSGYRVEGIYAFCNCLNDVRVRWTQLCKTSHSKTITEDDPDVIYPSELPPSLHIAPYYSGTASSDVSTDFYAVEALIGQVFYDCNPFMFEAEAGIHYGHVKYSESLSYFDTVGNEAYPSFSDCMNGIGPELTLDSDYALYNSECDCPGTLYFTTSLRGALLVSHSKANFFTNGQISDSDSPTLYTLADINDEKSWRVVPWWDMRLGLNYTSNFDCFAVSIEAGYEAGCYIKAISKERFCSGTFGLSPTGGVGYSFNEFQDFTYHGPYVSAEVMF